MSNTQSLGRTVSGAPRVREQARDALAVMVFSACAASALAAALLLLTILGQG